MTTKSRFALLVPLCFLLVAGCGSKKKGNLSGAVNYNGPVTGGTLTFYSAEGPTYPLAISSEGTYSIAQLPNGEYTVTIETESINPKNKPRDYAASKGRRPATSPAPKDRQPGGGGGSPKPPGHEDAPKGEYKQIPKKYGAKATSPLKVTVTGGSQKEDFNLEGPLEKGR